METTVRKSSVIQERMSLISTHMYQQFLDYKQANTNMLEVFEKMVENAALTVDYFKQSFASRGIPIQNIYLDYDRVKYYLTMGILWHKIGFITNYNDKPKALYREDDPPLFTGRIIAFNGTLNDITSNSTEEYMQKLLDLEVASLYVPADKTVSAIIKIKHLGNKEFRINQMDAPREFLLKVVEIICGGGDYHEESVRKTISF